MLNTCLTVRAHQANSHSGKGWERFTQKALDTVARVRTRGVVFLAWGTPAGKRVTGINRQKHCVLQSVHPSPLSAHRGFVCPVFPDLPTYMLTRYQFHCGHFKACNNWLAERYGPDEVIDWNLTQKKTSTLPFPSAEKSDKETCKDAQADFPEEKSQQKDDETTARPCEGAQGDFPEKKPQENGNKLAMAAAAADEFEEDADALEALAAIETTI